MARILVSLSPPPRSDHTHLRVDLNRVNIYFARLADVPVTRVATGSHRYSVVAIKCSQKSQHEAGRRTGGDDDLVGRKGTWIYFVLVNIVVFDFLLQLRKAKGIGVADLVGGKGCLSFLYHGGRSARHGLANLKMEHRELVGGIGEGRFNLVGTIQNVHHFERGYRSTGGTGVE